MGLRKVQMPLELLARAPARSKWDLGLLHCLKPLSLTSRLCCSEALMHDLELGVAYTRDNDVTPCHELGIYHALILTHGHSSSLIFAY